MPDDAQRAERKRQIIERLRGGSFDAAELSGLSSAELAALLAQTDIMRIPEIRLGLEQLVQVRQSQELGERLRAGMATLDQAITASVATLEQTIATSAASADRLNGTMVWLNRVVVVLSLVMAVAALIQIGQWVSGLRRPVPAQPASSAAGP